MSSRVRAILKGGFRGRGSLARPPGAVSSLAPVVRRRVDMLDHKIMSDEAASRATRRARRVFREQFAVTARINSGQAAKLATVGILAQILCSPQVVGSTS